MSRLWDYPIGIRFKGLKEETIRKISIDGDSREGAIYFMMTECTHSEREKHEGLSRKAFGLDEPEGGVTIGSGG